VNFSVLIPVYRKERPEYFKVSLESIVKQTFPPSEILVIKDGPLTVELNTVLNHFTDKYPSLFNVISLPEQIGLGKALNIGVLKCSYEIIARMDSDDICRPIRFEKQINFLRQHPEIDVIGSWIAEFKNNPLHIVSIRKVPIIHDEIFRFGKFRNPTNHMTVIFKRSAVMRAGNYLSFHLFEDYYLWVRMLMKGARFANIPENLVFVRGGSMFDRRSGAEYLKREINLHKRMLDLGFITYWEFLRNILVRIPVRLGSRNSLKILYKNYARR